MKKQKNGINKSDYFFGFNTFEDLYQLCSLTAFFCNKYNIKDIVDFYQKINPSAVELELTLYKKIEALVSNIYNQFDKTKKYNNMNLSDPEIINKIKDLLNNLLPF